MDDHSKKRAIMLGIAGSFLLVGVGGYYWYAAEKQQTAELDSEAPVAHKAVTAHGSHLATALNKSVDTKIQGLAAPTGLTTGINTSLTATTKQGSTTSSPAIATTPSAATIASSQPNSTSPATVISAAINPNPVNTSAAASPKLGNAGLLPPKSIAISRTSGTATTPGNLVTPIVVPPGSGNAPAVSSKLSTEHASSTKSEGKTVAVGTLIGKLQSSPAAANSVNGTQPGSNNAKASQIAAASKVPPGPPVPRHVSAADAAASAESCAKSAAAKQPSLMDSISTSLFQLTGGFLGKAPEPDLDNDPKLIALRKAKENKLKAVQQGSVAGVPGKPGSVAALPGKPGSVAAILGKPGSVAALPGKPGSVAALPGKPGSVAALPGKPGSVAALPGKPGSVAALPGKPGSVAALPGKPGSVAALPGKPGSVAALPDKPAAAAAKGTGTQTPEGKAASDGGMHLPAEVLATTPEAATKDAEANAGRPDPMQPLTAFLPFPHRKGSTAETSPLPSPSKDETTSDSDSDSSTSDSSDDADKAPGIGTTQVIRKGTARAAKAGRVPESLVPPPPPTTEALDTGGNNGLPLDQLPVPPSKPTIGDQVQVLAVMDDKVIIKFPLALTVKNKWPRTLTLSKGQEFESIKVVGVSKEGVTIEEDGERTLRPLPTVK